MKCGETNPTILTAPSGRPYYVSGIEQQDGKWYCKIRYTDNLEYKDVPYSQIYPTRLIIAGTRTFDNYNLLVSSVINFVDAKEIVSGCANGADTLGEQYAKQYGKTVVKYPADWNKYGKGAGHIRNKEMALYASHCIVFWDGKSKGTENMISLAKENGLTLKVVRY